MKYINAANQTTHPKRREKKVFIRWRRVTLALRKQRKLIYENVSITTNKTEFTNTHTNANTNHSHSPTTQEHKNPNKIFSLGVSKQFQTSFGVICCCCIGFTTFTLYRTRGPVFAFFSLSNLKHFPPF